MSLVATARKPRYRDPLSASGVYVSEVAAQRPCSIRKKRSAPSPQVFMWHSSGRTT